MFTGIPIVVVQAPTPSDVSRASSSVGSSRSETPETDINKSIASTARRSSNSEHSLSKDSVPEDNLSSCSETGDDTTAKKPCSNNDVPSTNFTVVEHGLSSQSNNTVTEDGLSSQPKVTDKTDEFFREEEKYFRSVDTKEQQKLSNNDFSESVIETHEANLDDETTKLARSDLRGRFLDPDFQDDITALSDNSADLDDTFETTEMANKSLMTSWSELEIVRAISKTDYSDTVELSRTIDSSPKITWGSTTTAREETAMKMSDKETSNDILQTSIGSATELRAILERNDPVGPDISIGSGVLGDRGSFDSDDSFSQAEDFSTAEAVGEHTQREYAPQNYTQEEPTDKENAGAISSWATQPDTETLGKANRRTRDRFKFRKATEEDAAEKIINEFLSSFDEGDVLGEDGRDTETIPVTPVQTTETQSIQKSVNDRCEKPQLDRIPESEPGDIYWETGQDELANSSILTNETVAQKSINDWSRKQQFDRIADTGLGDLNRENGPDELTKSGSLIDKTARERLISDKHGRPHYDKVLDNEPNDLDRRNGQGELTSASSLRNETTTTERLVSNRYTRSHAYGIPDYRSGSLDLENRPDDLSSILEDLEAISLLKSVELERERLQTVRGMRIEMEATFSGLPIEKIPACVYDKWQELIGDIIEEQDLHFQGLEEEQENLIRGMRLEIENLTKEMLGLRKIATDTESCKLENELLRKQLDGLEGYVSSLEGRIKCKTTENVNLMEELEDFRKEMTSKQAEVKNQVNDSEREIMNLRSEIGCMKEERLKLMNEIKIKDIEYKKLVNEKEKVKDELQCDVGKINANSISLRNRIMELQQENETLKTANEADQTIIRHLEIKEQNASDAMEELRKEKSKVLKDLEESRIKEVDMRKEQEVMNSEKNELMKQNDVWKEKVRQIGVEKQSVTQELNSKMNSDLKNIEAMLQELKNLESSLNSVRKEKSLIEDKYNTLKFENDRLHKMLLIKKRKHDKHDVNKSIKNNHQGNTDLLIDLGPDMNSHHGRDTPQSVNSVGQSSILKTLDTHRSSNVSRSTDFSDATALSTPRELIAQESAVTPLKVARPQNSLSQRKVTEPQETQPSREYIPSRNTISPSTNRRDMPTLYDSESESIDSYAPLPVSSVGYSRPMHSGFSNGTPVPDVMVVRVESPTRKHANGTLQTPVKRSTAPDQRQSQHVVGNGKSNSYSAEDTRFV